MWRLSMPQADSFGNIIGDNHEVDLELALAARNLIVCTEKSQTNAKA
jgi:hypothetical protein